jgi:acyl-coenzyme A thioesterase PaaI-like protein
MYVTSYADLIMSANLMRKMQSKIPERYVASIGKFIGNFYKPFRGAGIKIKHISKDYRHVEVVMPLKWSNRNYVGTHFGGSLYAMTDPFYMFIIMSNLGKNYIVWDKESRIKFIKPGRSEVHATFIITEEELNEIKAHVAEHGKMNFEKIVEVLDEKDQLIALVTKVIYIAKKEDLNKVTK